MKRLRKVKKRNWIMDNFKGFLFHRAAYKLRNKLRMNTDDTGLHLKLDRMYRIINKAFKSRNLVKK